MAVPAHDDRDWAFAKKFGCEIIEVVAGGNVEEAAFTAKDDTATLVNSDFLNGLSVKEAIPVITKWLEEKGIGEAKVNYKLRDWVFSRQRYWGEPIPIVHCPKCGTVPLDEKDLPLVLPEVESYEPTDDGESPLAPMTDWVNCKCPKCGGDAKRETDTMPQWAGSSWYFLRYMDPHNDKELASKEALDYWGQVDWYNGGMEHTTLHLLYSRFWNNFLHDIGVVPHAEPYAKRTSHGMILGKNPHYVGNVEAQEEKDALIAKYGSQALRPAVKMSKSLGNVVNPDDVIKAYGADTMRLYILFIGDFEKTATWSDEAVKGCKRFLDKVWNLAESVTDQETEISEKNMVPINKTIKKVGEDIDSLKANTAIASLMSLVNTMGSTGCNRAELKILLTLLSPFAPHICEELWESHGFEGYCSVAPWPEYDPAKTVDAEIDMAIQVNGKFRGTMRIAADVSKEDAIAAALETDIVKRQMAAIGGEVRKTIVVPGKLINLIIK
jgi:leucyl-tRNA synthetase